jgi:hypothetical protein
MMASTVRRLAVSVFGGLVLLAPAGALAQSTPQVELYGGFAVTASDLGDSYETFANGAIAELTLNMTEQLGLTGSFSFHGEKDDGLTTFYSQYYALGGLRFTPKRGPLTPFATALIGYTHVGSSSGLCAGIGAGLDFEVAETIGLRVEADALPNRLDDVSFLDFRVTAGLTLRFGALR